MGVGAGALSDLGLVVLVMGFTHLHFLMLGRAFALGVCQMLLRKF